MNNSLLPQHCFHIDHASEISAARRYGQRLAADIGFDETKIGKLAILITEAATNILKHAGSGKLHVIQTDWHGKRAIDILAADNGPGIGNLAFSFRDGVSTSGTSGTGLGALRRLSDEFDVYSANGKGACFFMRIWAEIPVSRQGLQIGAVCVPVAGEDVCGDAWAVSGDGSAFSLLVADGLGHGPDAAEAARRAVDTLRKKPSAQAGLFIEAADLALRGARGAALAISRMELAEARLVFSGVGNISACIVDDASRKQMVSHNGIVGNNVRKIQEFPLAFPVGALCIMHSDGISTQWDLEAYPGLRQRHPSIIALVLSRDFTRGRDDATVLVARHTESYSNG